MCTVRTVVATDEGGDETQYLATLCDAAKCVEDFCGYSAVDHLPVQYWADWCPSTRMVYFGGDWCDVPPLSCEAMPNDAIIEKTVAEHHTKIDCQASKNLRCRATF